MGRRREGGQGCVWVKPRDTKGAYNRILLYSVLKVGNAGVIYLLFVFETLLLLPSFPVAGFCLKE